MACDNRRLTRLKGMSTGFLFGVFSQSHKSSLTMSPVNCSSDESSVYLQCFNQNIGGIVPITSFGRLSHPIKTVDTHIWSYGQSRFQWINPFFHPLLIQLYLLSCLSNTMRVVHPSALDNRGKDWVLDKIMERMRSMSHEKVQRLGHCYVWDNAIVPTKGGCALEIQHSSVAVGLIGNVIWSLWMR